LGLIEVDPTIEAELREAIAVCGAVDFGADSDTAMQPPRMAAKVLHVSCLRRRGISSKLAAR
jgi:hypothetical protein